MMNKVNQCKVNLLTWEKVGLAAEPSSTFSFSAPVALLAGLDNKLEENISSTALPTEGSVLCDRSQAATLDDELLGGAGLGAMEMEAGVALTAVAVVTGG